MLIYRARLRNTSNAHGACRAAIRLYNCPAAM